jgi:E3 ubiquitin-protein ligase SIAH1
MEHVVQSVKVPCSSAIYGCTEMVPYYQKEEHEKVCPHPWGLFCPLPICTSFGPPEALLEHLTTEHQLPSTTLPDSGTVSLHLQQGLHALGRNGASYLFLLSLSLLPVGHAISVICVQLNDIEPKFTCNMSFESFTTGFSESSSFNIRSDSLSDGYPTGYDLILPKGKFPDDQKSILLTITIHQVLSVSGSDLQGKGPAAAAEQNAPFEYYSDDSCDHEDDDDDERGQLMLLKKIQALSVIRSSLQEKGLIPAPQRPKIIQGSLGLAIERNIFRD